MINLLRRGAAIVFILLTVVFWWLLSQGAASVIRAYEGRFPKPTASSIKAPASAAPSTPATTPSTPSASADTPAAAATAEPTATTATGHSETHAAKKTASAHSKKKGRSGRWSPEDIRDVVVLVTTLLAAIWAAARAVFPPEDFTQPAKQQTTT